METDTRINTTEDLYRMLDSWFRDDGAWWNSFYQDRNKGVPFFHNLPDESLVRYFSDGRMKPGRILELGCGPGRNALYMSKQGCVVDALDISEVAIQWARERAEESGLAVNFQCRSILDWPLENQAYDIVYDCGCLHHLTPHRRLSYIELVRKALKPDGRFGLVCFNTEGALDQTDWEIYENRKMKGGIGYTEDRLRAVLERQFEILEFCRMPELDPSTGLFGKDFLWTVLMQPR